MLTALALTCLSLGAGAPPLAATGRDNVLVVVLDDVGADAVSCYPGAAADARTPNLDRLAARGIRFDRVWSNPACSPTRATIMTGRYGFRTGVGSVKSLEIAGLRPEEVSLAESVRAEAPEVRTAFIGKWHLGPTEAQGPVPQGFEVFRGTSGNLRARGRARAYFEYDERQGREVTTTLRARYATSAVVDDALETIRGFGADPWVLIASFHAAHTPLHVPPEGLHRGGLSGPDEAPPRALFIAMVDALDHEVGRLVEGLPEDVRGRTHVIVVSDNGGASLTQAPGHPGRKGKGSLFEDGIRVPMIVAGPAVRGAPRASDALVNTTDLFATVHELLGARPHPRAEDSSSFADVLRGETDGVRRWCLAERFQEPPEDGRYLPVDRYTVTDGRFKRTVDVLGGTERLYDLAADPLERTDLLRADELPEDASRANAALSRVIEEELRRTEVKARRRRAAAPEPEEVEGAGPAGGDQERSAPR